MNPTTLLYGVADGVATIALDRVDSRNAVDRAMCEDLVAACGAAAADEAVRLVLLRANGPVFCAGADLKERKGMSADDIRARRLRAFAAYGAIERLPMPAIAVVHGPAVGSGCELAACCDFVIATPEAVFVTPEALWGTIGATQRLPRILGKRLAKDMMFTGRKLTAEEAMAAGWVTRVIAAEDLDDALDEIAKTIVAAPAAALRQAKSCIDRSVELDPNGALAVELTAMEENIARDTWRAGMSTFGTAPAKK